MGLAADQANAGHRFLLPSIKPASLGLRPVTNPVENEAILANRRAGKIVTCAGRLRCIQGRWWPYLGNHLDVLWDSSIRSMQSDVCELYYHAPLACPRLLTLSYVRSGPKTSLSTFYAATLMLDEIARIKQTGAIVCNVTSGRLTDRLLRRWGWDEHCEGWTGRHFIKRLYGTYPEMPEVWRQRLRLA